MYALTDMKDKSDQNYQPYIISNSIGETKRNLVK